MPRKIREAERLSDELWEFISALWEWPPNSPRLSNNISGETDCFFGCSNYIWEGNASLHYSVSKLSSFVASYILDHRILVIQTKFLISFVGFTLKASRLSSVRANLNWIDSNQVGRRYHANQWFRGIGTVSKETVVLRRWEIDKQELGLSAEALII